MSAAESHIGNHIDGAPAQPQGSLAMLKRNPIWASYVAIWTILAPAEKSRFLVVLGLTAIMALFELASVASILPFLSILAEPDMAQSAAFVQWFATSLTLETREQVALGLGLVTLAIVLIGMGVRALVTYAQLRFAMEQAGSISERLLATFLVSDYRDRLDQNSAQLAHALLSEVDTVVRENIQPAMQLVANLAIMALISGLLFIVSPKVALGSVTLLGGVYILSYFILRHRLERAGERRVASNRQRFLAIQDACGSPKEVKLMGIERTILQRFVLPARNMAKAQTAGLLMQRLPRYALEASVYGGLVTAILLLVIAQNERIDTYLPLLGLLGVAAMKLFPTLQQAYQQITSMRLSAPALEKLLQQLRDQDHSLETLPKGPRARLPLHRTLQFDQVSFTYPGAIEPALSGLSFAISARSSIGIVGTTGSGKSTLVDLVLGLLQPDRGAIKLDDKTLNARDIPGWQRNIGYVPQSIFLSDSTIAANIAFGRALDQIDLGRVRDVARLAQLDHFVETELPLGYDTMVGERGLRLSGGQIQRIGIARALYNDPEVLVLDEATSALDTRTERALMAAIDQLSGQKTVLLIAHRLSTVKSCDQILVIEEGKLAASGTYAQLKQNCSAFQSLLHADTS